MIAPSLCLDAETLRRLQAGQANAAEVEQCSAHLLQCQHCAAVSGAVNTADPFTHALRAGPTVCNEAEQTRIAALLARLQASPNNPPALRREPPAVPPRLAPPQRPNELGRLGRYRVLRVLGAGGMGTVYHAEDTQLQRSVALKVLTSDTSPTARQRFLREAQAIAALEHEQIVALYDVGEEQGVPFFAMPLLQGETLEARLAREGRLPVAEAVRLARAIAEGLAAAHARGLVHRDVKPANVWLESRPGAEPVRVKLLDFGLARAASDAHLTATDVIAGTPHYMSPEQARGEEVDARGDLFGLGCVLYRMLTGRLPFPGTQALSVLYALAAQLPPAPRALVPALPAALSALVVRLIEKDAARRPAHAADVATALAAMERAPQRSAPRWRRWVAAALLLLALGLGTVARFRSGEAESRHPSGPAPDAAANTLVEPRCFPGTGHSVIALALSPDGRRLLAGTGYRLMDGPSYIGPFIVRHLELDTGRERSRFVLHESPVNCVAFLAEGRQAFSCAMNRGLHVWDTDTGREWTRLPLSSRASGAIAASSDGSCVVFAGANGGLQCYDLATGQPLANVPEVAPRASVQVTALYQQRVLLAGAVPDVSGTGKPLHYVALADLRSGKILRTFEPADGLGLRWPIRSVAFSPDGARVLAAGDDSQLRLWETATGRELNGVPTGHRRLWQAAFTPTGGIVVGAEDGTVRLWDPDRATEVACFRGHQGPVRSVVASADGRIAVSGGQDGTVRVWRLP